MCRRVSLKSIVAALLLLSGAYSLEPLPALSESFDDVQPIKKVEIKTEGKKPKSPSSGSVGEASLDHKGARGFTSSVGSRIGGSAPPARRVFPEKEPSVCLAFLSCCGRTDLLEQTLHAAVSPPPLLGHLATMTSSYMSCCALVFPL
jgi:hypothetical protein